MSSKHRRFSLHRYITGLRDRIRRNRKSFIIYSVLRIFVILTLITSVIQHNYENAALCGLSLVLFLMPSFFEKRLEIEIPPLFEIIIYLFIFAAEILGEVNHFYTAIPGWDTMLHTLNGFLCAAIGFAMVDLLNRHSKLVDMSPFYLAVAAFCFSMTIGVIWEFIEFSADQFFGLDMQKDFIVQSISSVNLDPTHSQVPYHISHITRTIIETKSGKQYVIEGGYLDIGIIDTMKDLFVNFVGAIVCSVLGYFYVKTRDPKSFVGRLMIHSMSAREVEEVETYLDEQQKKRDERHTKEKEHIRENIETVGEEIERANLMEEPQSLKNR